MISSGLALYLAVVRLLFTLGWTVYALYLPQLLETAGLPTHYAATLILLDQVIFLVADVVLGAASDLVERWLGRLGLLIAALSLLSGVMFAVLPLLAEVHGAVLLACVVFWSLTSSILRVPPVVLLGRYAAAPRRPWLLALLLSGVALAGMVSPFVSAALTDISPYVPFALSGLVLGLSTLGLVLVDRQRRRHPLPEAQAPRHLGSRWRPIQLGLLVAGALVVGLGVQVHTSLTMAPLFLALTEEDAVLRWLMPVFWVGFHAALFPAAALTRRLGGGVVLPMGALLGGGAALLCALAPGLPLLVALQFGAGCGWAALLVAGMTVALGLGGRGFEGLTLGAWFAALSTAAAARVLMQISGVSVQVGPMVTQLGVGGLWMSGALLFLPLAIWFLLRPAERV